MAQIAGGDHVRHVGRVALLVMSIRFVGVPESVLSWVAIFCVWAIVRG